MQARSGSARHGWARWLALAAVLAAAKFALGMAPAIAAEAVSSAARRQLPAPLVFLADIEPGIRQDMRYATADNFTGRPVPGYEAPECVLTLGTAKALARAQREVAARGYSLKVYDCYRPERAVRAFTAWAAAPEEAAVRRFHPRLDKSRLFASGYISRDSSHSRGISVDLTIVPAAAPPAPSFDPAASYGRCDGPAAQRAPDDSLDMGTGFDCFDAKSHDTASDLTAEQRRVRRVVYAAMTRAGFRGYSREWWHFTLEQPDNERAYDLPIPRREIAAAGVPEPRLVGEGRAKGRRRQR